MGMDGGTTAACGVVPATIERQAKTQEPNGSADSPWRREFSMAGSSVTPGRREVYEKKVGPSLQSNSGGVTFPRSLKNLGNTCFFNATMQALASIAKIVEEIVKIQPLEHQDSALRIITYLQRDLLYIARGSHTPSDVLQWEEIRAEGRRTTVDDWLDFVRRATSWGDKAFRRNMTSDPEDLLRTILAILPSVNAMLAFEVITNIQCVCGEAGGSGRSRVSTSTQRQMYDTIVLPQSEEPSLSARICQFFATELVMGYRCPECKTRSTLHHPTTLQRTICLLPEYLMVSIAKPVSTASRTRGQRQSELCDFVHLDLSGIAHGEGPRSHYTLCADILFREQHYWTYLHDPTAICVNDSCSRPATEQDLSEVARCARILFFGRDSFSRATMGTHASLLSARGATRREEEMEGSTGAADPPHEETGDGPAGAPGRSRHPVEKDNTVLWK